MLALTLLFLAVAAQALPAPSKTVGINSFTLPHLDYSAVKASGVSLGAFSKSTGDSSPRTSTDSCNEQQYEAFIERTDQCISQAKSPLDTIGFEDLENVLCSSMRDELDCIKTIGPQCFDAEDTKKINLNALERMFQMAYNATFLGQRFMDSCPALSREEANLVRSQTGSNKCTYSEAELQWREFAACKGAALSTFESVMLLIQLKVFPDPRSTYVNANCNYYTEIERCSLSLYTCFGPQKEAEWNQGLLEAMKKDEESLKEVLGPDFTFDVCSNLSDRNDEFAVVQISDSNSNNNNNNNPIKLTSL